MEFTGERYIPGQSNIEMEVEHLQRYQSIRELVKNKVVLDIACGEGYGSFILSNYANHVHGIDIDGETIEHANTKYNEYNLSYSQGSAVELPFGNKTIDIVVSFETIEHIDSTTQNIFLQEVKRVLKNDGLLVISTPDKRWYSDETQFQNPFHIREFYKDEFHSFLTRYFENVELYFQKFEIASIIGKPESTNFLHLSRGHKESLISEGKYLISICSDQSLRSLDISTIDLSHDKEFLGLMKRVVGLQNEVQERNIHIKNINDQISNYITKLNEKDLKIIEVTTDLSAARKELFLKDNQIIDKDNQIIDKDNQISELQTQLDHIQSHVNQLLEQERKLHAVYESGGWKLLNIYYRVRDRIVPPRSKRRLLVRLLKMTIQNPRKMLNHLNKSNVKKVRYYLKTEQPSRLENRIENYIARHVEETTSMPLHLMSIVEHKERLTFPIYEEPLVSIVIPVYNQWEYTYGCLKSILANTNDVSYEVIVADDMSSDGTVEIGAFVSNITVVRDGVNKGFLLNCNNAAQQARGKYLFFLNNDTSVQPQWLSSVLNLMQNDNNIGMAGSKLVYPDGKLQEAGGIIWRDATGWNFGRLDDPSKPEYNYVKDVDYISGAAIMMRMDLWQQIGGFDERYVPAYCEDSDLAFEVRERGYRVVLQPASVIVHYEGITHGTNTGIGVKSYQIANKEKFLMKWNRVLQNEHFDNSSHVFLARDRSRRKKTLLVIDHYVPHYDKDAGSRTILQYIDLFTGSLGYNVKFVGDNFYKHEPYTSKLQQMGVEVLYGEWFANHFRDWLRANGEYIDYIFLSRPHISIKYIDMVKQFTNAKIIYYGHDLHYLRELREYQLTGNKALLESSEKWKKIEFELIGKADVTYYPSQVEIDEILNELPGTHAQAIPAYIYEDRLVMERDIEGSKDLVFVGGFGHKPNVDAVLWFAQSILPQLIKRIPSIKIYIIGSNPPDDIKALVNENLIVTGFVTDEELEQFYWNARLVVVPLRYGAGVKGKVVEALYHQCPIITTRVGAEGLKDIESYLEIADSEDDFINKTVTLYNDTDRLRTLSQNTRSYVKSYFSKECVMSIIHSDFN